MGRRCAGFDDGAKGGHGFSSALPSVGSSWASFDRFTPSRWARYSRDGVHWIKDPANPVLPKGEGTDWTTTVTGTDLFCNEGGTFKMWYGGGMDRHCDWGYTTSTDGVHFVKHGQLSHLGNVEDDHVVHDKSSGRYFMYYWDRKHEPMGLFCAQSPNETDFDFSHAQPLRIEGLQYPAMYKFTHVLQEGGLLVHVLW